MRNSQTSRGGTSRAAGRRRLTTLALIASLIGSASLGRGQELTRRPPSTSTAETSTAAAGLTVEQVYELAARDNLQINAVRRRRTVAETGVIIAGQRPNPEFVTGYTRTEPRLNLSISQAVELGGKRARRLEVARGEVRLAELDIEAALRLLRRDVRLAYFNLALARDIFGLGRQSLEQTVRLAGIAQARFDAGDVAQFEVLQARLGVARARNELARLENAERGARALLNQLLNRAPDAPLALQDALFVSPASLATTELIARALAQNVELRAAEQQIATEQSRLQLARAARVPDLVLEPGIESIDSSLPNNYGFKMQVTVPLPVFNRGRGETARSSALIAQLTAERDAARQRISSEIGQAALRLDAARQQVSFYEANLLPDAEHVRQLAEEAYRAGQTGILPVTDAQRSAREVRQGYLQALFDYQSALAELEEAAGVALR